MKIGLERHAYAPELNKAIILNKRGDMVATVPAPGCTTIAQARAHCFPRYEARRVVTASYVRDGEFASLNRTIRAAYPLEPNTMVRIACHARGLVDKGGALNDGRILPPAKLQLNTRLAYVKAKAA